MNTFSINLGVMTTLLAEANKMAEPEKSQWIVNCIQNFESLRKELFHFEESVKVLTQIQHYGKFENDVEIIH